ncbi:MAG: hypothetical protein GEU75_17715 [Dehalococcoidia bacterium]|nr:hypothetical protein [Dehalococcoidia bacterium]
MKDENRAQKLEEAINKLREAAELLNEFYDDPRVRLVLPELEGLDRGWFHWSTEDQDYLVDQLIDLLLEAQGNPVEDHWRGHPLTVAEAEALL